MGLGMSGAHLFVVKTGTGVQAQAEYMRELGTSVCPEILNVEMFLGAEAIAMEMCRAPHYSMPEDLIADMECLLSAHVWSRDTQVRPEWRIAMGVWLQNNAPWLESQFVDLYPPTRNLDGCYIHGDPTIANALWRDGHGLLITDPLRWGGKIPPLREVDQGKLLQSCRGYESTVLGLGYSRWEEIFLHPPPAHLVTEKSWFWSNVHLMRAVPYLERAGHHAPAAWARREAQREMP